jgi:hypothetical protein
MPAARAPLPLHRAVKKRVDIHATDLLEQISKTDDPDDGQIWPCLSHLIKVHVHLGQYIVATTYLEYSIYLRT